MRDERDLASLREQAADIAALHTRRGLFEGKSSYRSRRFKLEFAINVALFSAYVKGRKEARDE